MSIKSVVFFSDAQSGKACHTYLVNFRTRLSKDNAVFHKLYVTSETRTLFLPQKLPFPSGSSWTCFWGERLAEISPNFHVSLSIDCLLVLLGLLRNMK